MKRDQRLIRLSREHTQALMLALRIDRELPAATDEQASALYSTLIAFWSAGLLPHFRTEGECLLARLVRHVADDDPRIERLHRDHLRLEALVVTMRDLEGRPGPERTEGRRRALLEFGAVIRAHVRWEEETLFPAIEELLTPSELDALGADIASRLPEHPLPYWEAAAE